MNTVALISPYETIDYPMPDGSTIVCWRVAQTGLDEYKIPVAEPLFWTPCNDTVVANDFVYNPDTQEFLEIPKPVQADVVQPQTSGLDTL